MEYVICQHWILFYNSIFNNNNTNNRPDYDAMDIMTKHEISLTTRLPPLYHSMYVAAANIRGKWFHYNHKNAQKKNNFLSLHNFHENLILIF